MDDPQIDKQLGNAWRNDKCLTSERENYIFVVQDQELFTKFLKNKREIVGKIQVVIINADYILTTWKISANCSSLPSNVSKILPPL